MACDATPDLAVGMEQRVTYRRRIDSASVERVVQAQHQLAARSSGHGTTTDAIGNDEKRSGPIERAMRILVHRAPPAARARGCHFEADPRRHAYRVPAAPGCYCVLRRGERHARATISGFQIQWHASFTHCAKSVSWHSGSLPVTRPSAIDSPAFQRTRAPGECDAPAMLTPLSP